MRSTALLVLVAACGFTAPAGTAQPGDDAQPPPPADAPPEIDAPVPPAIDAAIDAPILPIDAPCADDDMDGTCDAVDTWPCGATPAMPGNTVTWDNVDNQQRHQTITLTGAQAGGTKLLVVAPGATVTVGSGYSIRDCICQGCIDQIQIGLVPGTTKKCLYDANPSCSPASTGSGNVTITAPMTPGVYDLRFRLGQDYGCNGENGTNTGWWVNQAPAPQQTVAKICVY
jgi:hypothetical protein